MQTIHFTTQERVKINRALEIFFKRSSTKDSTTKGLITFDIISILGFMVDYGYFVDCSFGSGNMANETYILFIRDDMPQITAKNGVYCRVCFERKTNKIKVNINTSYKIHINSMQNLKSINISHKPKNKALLIIQIAT